MILTITGVFFTVLYVWFGFSFKMPVFAVFSSFIETRMFVTFRTNFADELIILLCLAGFFLMMFSKEKNEKEYFDSLRLKAFAKTIILNTILLFLSCLFVYGYGFIIALVLNCFSIFIFYLIFFYFLKYKYSQTGL
jgi:hypothetical protein